MLKKEFCKGFLARCQREPFLELVASIDRAASDRPDFAVINDPVHPVEGHRISENSMEHQPSEWPRRVDTPVAPA